MEAPWVRSYSVVRCVRRLMGRPLCCSAADNGLWGERAYGDRSTCYPATHDSAESPCFHGCLVFLRRRLPPQSPPSHPLHPSLHSQQQPSPWGCSASPNSSSQPLPLPGDLCPCPGCVWLRQALILIPFRPPQLSCFTVRIKRLSSDSDIRPMWASVPASVPPPAEGRTGPTNTPVFPLVPSSYRVLCGSI